MNLNKNISQNSRVGASMPETATSISDRSEGNTDPDSSTRIVGSTQQDALQNITGQVSHFCQIDGGVQSGALTFEQESNQAPSGSGSINGTIINFDASLSARTSTETRPINTAVIYAIKAS